MNQHAAEIYIAAFADAQQALTLCDIIPADMRSHTKLSTGVKPCWPLMNAASRTEDQLRERCGTPQLAKMK